MMCEKIDKVVENLGGGMVFEDETISAVATAAGEGAIGIVRMSGNKAIAIVSQIFQGIKLKKNSRY